MYPYVAYVQFGLAVSELPTVFITNFYLMEKSFFLGCADDPRSACPPASREQEAAKTSIKMAVINMGRINSFCTLCYVIHHEEIGRWLNGVRTGNFVATVASTCMKKIMTLVLYGRVAMMCSSLLIADWRMGTHIHILLLTYMHTYHTKDGP